MISLRFATKPKGMASLLSKALTKRLPDSNLIKAMVPMTDNAFVYSARAWSHFLITQNQCHDRTYSKNVGGDI